VTAGAARDVTGTLSRDIAATLRAHPAVAGLSAGPHAAIATPLPGERLLGVRVGAPGEPVEVSVVLRLLAPLPDLVEQLRAAVSARCGGAPVDVHVSDVVVP
jgi:hypothetical protein